MRDIFQQVDLGLLKEMENVSSAFMETRRVRLQVQTMLKLYNKDRKIKIAKGTKSPLNCRYL